MTISKSPAGLKYPAHVRNRRSPCMNMMRPSGPSPKMNPVGPPRHRDYSSDRAGLFDTGSSSSSLVRGGSSRGSSRGNSAESSACSSTSTSLGPWADMELIYTPPISRPASPPEMELSRAGHVEEPVAPGDHVKVRVVRHKGGVVPRYDLVTEDGSCVLLSARKTSNSKFRISTKAGHFESSSPHVLAELQCATLMDSTYRAYKMTHKSIARARRPALAAVSFAGSQMSVALSREAEGCDKLFTLARSADETDKRRVWALETRDSHAGWSSTSSARKASRILDSEGKMTALSTKTFQLVRAAGLTQPGWGEAEREKAAAPSMNDTNLQFAREGDDAFTCEFAWPLSPLQAFVTCLARFDDGQKIRL